MKPDLNVPVNVNITLTLNGEPLEVGLIRVVEERIVTVKRQLEGLETLLANIRQKLEEEDV